MSANDPKQTCQSVALVGGNPDTRATALLAKNGAEERYSICHLITFDADQIKRAVGAVGTICAPKSKLFPRVIAYAHEQANVYANGQLRCANVRRRCR